MDPLLVHVDRAADPDAVHPYGRNIFDSASFRGKMDRVNFVVPGDAQEGIPWLCVVDPAYFRFYICDLLSFNGSSGVNY